jgi:hypothetical protein
MITQQMWLLIITPSVFHVQVATSVTAQRRAPATMTNQLMLRE